MRSVWQVGVVMLLSVHLAMASVHQWQLSNGLRVFFIPDHRAQAVLSQVWYKVGSMDEPLGLTGISHMLEHVMFLGTKKYPKGAYASSIAAVGGYVNAMTYQDATVFYGFVPKKHWPMVLALEADRMQYLEIDNALFLSERAVVQEERRMRMEDNPAALALERMSASLFISSPYHHQPIGWMHDIQNYTVRDCRTWYRKWYVPNNAFLVIVGDLTLKEAKAQVQQAFGSIARGSLPVRKPVKSVASLSRIEQRMQHPLAQTPMIFLSKSVPTVASAERKWEPYALRLLAAVLSEGRSARLDKALKYDRHQVVQVGISYDPLARLDTAWTVRLVPGKSVLFASLIDQVQTMIKAVATDGVSPQELARAKMQITASFVYQQDNWENRALQLGRLALIDCDPDPQAFIKKLQAITPSQVQQVAARYFANQEWVVLSLKESLA